MTRQEEIDKLKEKIDTLLKWGYTFHLMEPGEGLRGNIIKEIVIPYNATDEEVMARVDKALKDSDSFYNILYTHIRSKGMLIKDKS